MPEDDRSTPSQAENVPLTLAAEVEEPSYAECLGWMQELPADAHISLDFWARGNFVRRLLHQRKTGVEPLLVPASHPNQMRWAFRRLALVGLPVDFVYSGPMAKPRWVKHWHPLDLHIDSGWGYIVFAGTVVKSASGRDWWPILGFSSLMPPGIPDWIMREVPKSFQSGRVSVAPAELIGVNRRSLLPEVSALAEVARGVPTSPPEKEIAAILNLELPWVDGMTPEDFERLLVDHEGELADFQAAFRALITVQSDSQEKLEVALRRFRASVDEVHRSRRLEQFRTLVAKCKGNLTSFPVAMGVLAAAGAVYAQDPFAGAAVAGAAGKALQDLWSEARHDAESASRHPLRLIFRLGVEKARFRSAKKSTAMKKIRLEPPVERTPCHWLCPPSGAGLRFAMAGEE